VLVGNVSDDKNAVQTLELWSELWTTNVSSRTICSR